MILYHYKLNNFALKLLSTQILQVNSDS